MSQEKLKTLQLLEVKKQEEEGEQQEEKKSEESSVLTCRETEEEEQEVREKDLLKDLRHIEQQMKILLQEKEQAQEK